MDKLKIQNNKRELILQECLIKELLSGTPLKGGKSRIKDFFSWTSNHPERINILKEEYGVSGKSDPKTSVYYDSKGLKLMVHEQDIPIGRDYSWSEIVDVIDSLIQANKY